MNNLCRVYNDYRHPVLSKACEVGILKDVLTVEGFDYRSLREEGLFASISGEISAIFRKPRTFVKEDGGLDKYTRDNGRGSSGLDGYVWRY